MQKELEEYAKVVESPQQNKVAKKKVDKTVREENKNSSFIDDQGRELPFDVKIDKHFEPEEFSKDNLKEYNKKADQYWKKMRIVIERLNKRIGALHMGDCDFCPHIKKV